MMNGQMNTQNNIDSACTQMPSAEDLRSLRQKYLISQNEVAYFLGKGKSTIQSYESGRSKMSLDDYGKLKYMCLNLDPSARSSNSNRLFKRTSGSKVISKSFEIEDLIKDRLNDIEMSIAPLKQKIEDLTIEKLKLEKMIHIYGMVNNGENIINELSPHRVRSNLRNLIISVLEQNERGLNLLQITYELHKLGNAKYNRASVAAALTPMKKQNIVQNKFGIWTLFNAS